jgi:hypothetical protein
MFINETIAARTEDGHNFVLLEPLTYCANDSRLLRAPVGATTDGISTPDFIWNIIPPFGATWFSGVLHDAGYRDTLQICTDVENNIWEPAHYTQDQCDLLMRESLLAHGVGVLEVEVIYHALSTFGSTAFHADRANPITCTST